jgi:hypothetical protein
MKTDRKRGRIELNHEVRRDISIQFRVNKAEFEYLKELVEASGLERGHYIRREILNSEPIVKEKCRILSNHCIKKYNIKVII